VPTLFQGRHILLNWDNKTLAEILEYYVGNIFMAEMDYKDVGLDDGQWVMLIKDAYDKREVSPTVMMLMAERAAAR
jgi:hypothetical protein